MLLRVEGLRAGYGRRPVLEGIGFSAQAGEIVAIIGPNGSGKSTLIKALMGLNNVYAGQAWLDSRDVLHLPTHQRIRMGMVFLPQGNRVFDELSVRENLELGGITLRPDEVRRRLDEVLPLFPQLGGMLKRAACTLSGGERQMVAFARAMILGPRLLLLDEPSIGLSPKLVAEVLGKTREIRDRLNCTVLVVEQKVEQVLTIADRVLGLHLGRIVFDGEPSEASEQARQIFLI